MNCCVCGRDLNPGSSLVLREVVGWIGRRSAGGPNAISFKEETGRFMCDGCARKRRQTGFAEQGKLL